MTFIIGIYLVSLLLYGLVFYTLTVSDKKLRLEYLNTQLLENVEEKESILAHYKAETALIRRLLIGYGLFEVYLLYILLKII